MVSDGATPEDQPEATPTADDDTDFFDKAIGDEKVSRHFQAEKDKEFKRHRHQLQELRTEIAELREAREETPAPLAEMGNEVDDDFPVSDDDRGAADDMADGVAERYYPYLGEERVGHLFAATRKAGGDIVDFSNVLAEDLRLRGIASIDSHEKAERRKTTQLEKEANEASSRLRARSKADEEGRGVRDEVSSGAKSTAARHEKTEKEWIDEYNDGLDFEELPVHVQEQVKK